MRKFLLVFAIVSILFSTSALAGTCTIPKFLKKGAKIDIFTGMSEIKDLPIIEIDKKACWIKIGQGEFDGYWINLNTLLSIKPAK